MTEQTKEHGSSRNSGNGSFWIPKQVIDAFTTPSRPATAVDIVTYLVLARYTDETGRFSSAGIQAIVKATGITRKMAEQALDRLQAFTPPATPPIPKAKKSTPPARGLVSIPPDWNTRTGEKIPERPTMRSQIRWVLDDFDCDDEERVWFSNELIDGYGRFQNPLKRLKQCGDIAARLLLLMYRENDMEACGGVPPFPNTYKKYNTEIRTTCRGYGLWIGKFVNSTAYDSIILPSLSAEKYPADEERKAEFIKPFWNALESLESTGLIYEIVTVMDSHPGNKYAQPMYVLHTRSANGYTPKGEEGLGGHVARIVGDMGYPVTDAQGRFYGTFGAIVPAGINPHIAGIFRLRFRVANPKNYGVKSAWARIYKGQEEAKEWLEFFEGKGLVLPPGSAGDSTSPAESQGEQPRPTDRPELRLVPPKSPSEEAGAPYF